MDIGQKLKQRRLELGLTLEQVGAIVGVAKSTVQKWEGGKIANMRRDRIALYAKALQVSPAFIMGLDEAIDKIGGQAYQPSTRIPILGKIRAGSPLYAEQNIEGYTMADLNHSAEYFALRVTGDSMTAANINPGDLLIVRRQTIVDDGDIAVVMVGDDDATVKRFYHNGDFVVLMPQSINPDHRPQQYDLRKTKIIVLGKVVRNEISFE